jgi:hypothetical protein
MAGSDEYIRFDQYEDVVASLELVAKLAPLVGEKPQCWKWMIIGAHSALQGAMVCALFDRAAVLKKANPKNKKAAKQETASGVPQEWIEGRIEVFQVLLKRCVAGNRFCEPLVLTLEQRADIGKLHREYRNDFVHFAPHQGWAIAKVKLPPMIEAALFATEDLMGRYYVMGNLDEQQRLTDALVSARAHLPASVT